MLPLVACEIICTRLILENEMFIDQSKANLDENILFGKNHSSFRPRNKLNVGTGHL